jgi:hypothetical protein
MVCRFTDFLAGVLAAVPELNSILRVMSQSKRVPNASAAAPFSVGSPACADSNQEYW